MTQARLSFFGLILSVVLFSPIAANAGLIDFDIDFGANGSGSFQIDSADLAAIPASGLHFGPSGSVKNFSATIDGILFDILGATSQFAAADGQLSGVTGICCTVVTSSLVVGAELVLNTCSGAPCNTSYSVPGSASVSLQYTVSGASVPAPATVALFGLGLAGLGWSRCKRH